MVENLGDGGDQAVAMMAALTGFPATWSVTIRSRPPPAYSDVSRRLSSSGSALCISTSSRSVSMPKSVNAMTPSSRKPPVTAALR